jgi:hypothetical protein
LHQIFDVAECLLRHGADINQLNALGRTVLHESIRTEANNVFRGLPALASWIIRYGADLEKRSEARTVQASFGECHEPGGLSPLMMAIDEAKLCLVQSLIRAGARFELPLDAEGRWKPFDLAFMSRQLSIIQVLERAGASFSVDVEKGTSSWSGTIDDETRLRFQGKARALMSYCLSGSSRGLLPIPGCEDVYRLVLSADDFRQAWQSRGAIDGPLKYQGPVDAFFRILSSIAQTRNLQAVPDSYCTRCRNMIANFSLLPPYDTDGSFRHASSLRDFEHAAAFNKCPFCRLLLDALDAGLENNRQEPKTAGNNEPKDCPVELNLDLAHYPKISSLRVVCGDRSYRLAVSPLEGKLYPTLVCSYVPYSFNFLTVSGRGSPATSTQPPRRHGNRNWLSSGFSSRQGLAGPLQKGSPEMPAASRRFRPGFASSCPGRQARSCTQPGYMSRGNAPGNERRLLCLVVLLGEDTQYYNNNQKQLGKASEKNPGRVPARDNSGCHRRNERVRVPLPVGRQPLHRAGRS